MSRWKPALPYVCLPFLMLGLWLVKAGRIEGIVLLLREIVLVFGYAAAIGDLRKKRVPNQLVLAMLGAWVVVMIPQLFLRTEYALALAAAGLIGFAVAGALFLVVYYVSRKGLGGGDVKFMAASGLYLGGSLVLPTMLYGSVLAAVVGLTLLLLKKVGRKDTIPLVPFLYVGMLLTIFFQ